MKITLLCSAAFLGSCSAASAAITIPTVAVGSAGNAADPMSGYGAVEYNYRVGTTEVTNAQYTAFLNAVAAADTNGLYNPDMASGPGGIARSGQPGSYTYATTGGRGNNPVTFVSFWSSARFTNWLHNGQPSGGQNAGTTEDGAYTLTQQGIINNTVTRNAGWRWAITSEAEWYKAAYYQPAAQGGPQSGYWLYPTSSNDTPTVAQANYLEFFTSTTGDARPVASYSPNFWGAFDMGGNVWEWGETIIEDRFRGYLGGAFDYYDYYLRAGNNRYIYNTPSGGFGNLGFRVSQIPGPSALALLAVGAAATLRRRRARLA